VAAKLTPHGGDSRSLLLNVEPLEQGREHQSFDEPSFSRIGSQRKLSAERER
jgi:hypothetical protein